MPARDVGIGTARDARPRSRAPRAASRTARGLRYPGSMLRISTSMRPGGATLRLEGRLAGPWVGELARCWASVTATRDPGSIRVELEAVTFIDPAGKALLRTMHERGTALLGSGCMTRAILAEIETKS
jgi:hypothetical protein